MSRLIGSLTVGVALLGSIPAARQAPSVGPAEVKLGVKGHANATPWIAAKGNFVAVAWGATAPDDGTDIYVAVSRDAGRSFGAPLRVNQQPGTARVGGELPPRVALGPSATTGDPPMTVVWGAKLPRTAILAAHSGDGGRTFERHQILSSETAEGDRGWHALALSSGGAPHVMWLDHRGLAARPKSTHDHHGDGADIAQFSGLYHYSMTRSSRDREVAKGVCYCCKLAMAAGRGNELFVAWRHVYPGNIRDIAFAMSSDDGRTFSAPLRIGEDNWQLAGCPDDGPAMAVGTDGTIHIVWPTVIGGESPRGSLFHASSRDGRSFTARRQIPTRGGPRPMHPQVIVDSGGRLLVAWDEVIDGARQASARSLGLDSAGNISAGPLIDLGDAPSAYPVLAMSGRGPIAVWTQGAGDVSEIVVRALR